jgi:hypothetical protein
MRSAMFLGLGAWAFTWGAVLIDSTPAAANLPGGVFAASVSGAVEARPRGDAAFGLVGQPGAPATFSITLTSPGDGGAVVLTGRAEDRPLPGRTYRISDGGEPGTFRALYLAGSPAPPNGRPASSAPPVVRSRFSPPIAGASRPASACTRAGSSPRRRMRTIARSPWRRGSPRNRPRSR